MIANRKRLMLARVVLAITPVWFDLLDADGQVAHCE